MLKKIDLIQIIDLMTEASSRVVAFKLEFRDYKGVYEEYSRVFALLSTKRQILSILVIVFCFSVFSFYILQPLFKF